MLTKDRQDRDTRHENSFAFFIKRYALAVKDFLDLAHQLINKFRDVVESAVTVKIAFGPSSHWTFSLGRCLSLYKIRMLPTLVVRRCRVNVRGVVTPSPVGVAMLKLRYPSPPKPSDAM